VRRDDLGRRPHTAVPASWARVAVAVCLLPLLAGCGEVDPETTYVCPPCAAHDTLNFDADGRCPVCGMQLIEAPDSSAVGRIHLHQGSGNVLVEGGIGHEEKLITIFYHRPEGFGPDSPILFVLPGAGRNAWDYRDAWVEAAEEQGILVLSLRYPETTYDFHGYHMGGVVEASNLLELVTIPEGSAQAMLDETRLTVEPSERPSEWIFHDFDRIFERVAATVESERGGYDIFGHSAGAQILHRMVLFRPDTKARRIVAANAGFYTLPDHGVGLPFGLGGTPVDEEDLRDAFRSRLILLLGEEDDHREVGGTFLRSPSADAQGAGRLQRGRHFYEAARTRARQLDVELRWTLETVPGVGHDQEGMARAAAELLYGGA